MLLSRFWRFRGVRHEQTDGVSSIGQIPETLLSVIGVVVSGAALFAGKSDDCGDSAVFFYAPKFIQHFQISIISLLVLIHRHRLAITEVKDIFGFSRKAMLIFLFILGNIIVPYSWWCTFSSFFSKEQ